MRMRSVLRLVVMIVLLGVLLAQASSSRFDVVAQQAGSAEDRTWTASSTVASYPNCRFGAAQTGTPVSDLSQLDTLNLGWYLDWSSKLSPATPHGMEYAQMVRVGDAWWPLPVAELSAKVAANPGALWLIGNEPDRKYNQDDVLPEVYAQRYHEAYHAIKDQDPTAVIAAGGIVQPTPIRLECLDRALQAYQDLYGEPLPADAWHIHSFILREASCEAYPDSCWGADVPRGFDVPAGELYTLDDIADLDIFKARIWEFRQWMRDRGYRDTALLITEYSTLLPYYTSDLYYDSNGEPFDEARTSAFMTGSFDFFLNATDPALGYPEDNNRIVQRWLWWSLDDKDYGGRLYDATGETPVLEQLGHDLAAYTGAIEPAVDLVAVDVEQINVPFSLTDPATVTLKVRVANAGNVATGEPTTVTLTDGGGQPIDDPQAISAGLAGCASVTEYTFTWSDLAPGAHSLRVEVDPDDVVVERDENNNELQVQVLVSTARVLMPLVSRGR
ncbi:MAG: Ig-like domain-containing protein [Anaerolineae bacterium]